MPDLIDAVANLTDARDRDALESTLAHVLFELIGPSRLTLWRLVSHEGTIRLRQRVRLTAELAQVPRARANGDYERLGRRFEPPARAMNILVDDDMPALAAYPALQACHTAKRHVRWAGGAGERRCRHAFPIFHRREIMSILEIQSHAPLDDAQERMVAGLLRVYLNHLGVLDHSDCDDLTGLLNRRTFDKTFRKIVNSELIERDAAARVNGPPGRRRPPLAKPQAHLAVIDIDFFKRINDEFGHPYGDEVLVLITRLMAHSFRDTDYLFRFGGEEFIVILTDTNAGEAWVGLEKFRAAVEAFEFPQVGRVTVSVGFTELHTGDTGSNAFGRADQALYVAKRTGRNRLHQFEQLIASGQLQLKAKAAAQDVELF